VEGELEGEPLIVVPDINYGNADGPVKIIQVVEEEHGSKRTPVAAAVPSRLGRTKKRKESIKHMP
jgi:hypothetical protein